MTARSAPPAQAAAQAAIAAAATSLRSRWRTVRVVVLFLHEAGDGHDLVLAFDVDQRDALGGTSDGADIVGRHAENHALLGDQQQLVAFLDVGDADDKPVFLRRRDVDDADAAARLHAVLFDFGALPEPA